MPFFKSKAKPSETHDVNRAMETANVEKGLSPVQNENAVDQQVIDAELERRVVRKTDRNLVPLVMALCTLHCTLTPPAANSFGLDLLAFLDRSNVGYACPDKAYARLCSNKNATGMPVLPA
jgi:hypothetical protein